MLFVVKLWSFRSKESSHFLWNYSHIYDRIYVVSQGRKENLMAVSYDKLFHLLIDRQMSNSELIKKAGFSGNVMTQIKRRKYISLDSIERICRALGCGVDDILEFIDEGDL